MTAPGRLITLVTAACRAAEASRDWQPGDRLLITAAAAADSAWYARGYPAPPGDRIAADLAGCIDAIVFRDDLPLGDIAWAGSRGGRRAEPMDRMTRVCAAAGDVLGGEESHFDRAVIMARSPDRAGMCISGYAAAGDELALRQQVAWDLAACLYAVLGYRKPRRQPGTWPLPPSPAGGPAWPPGLVPAPRRGGGPP